MTDTLSPVFLQSSFRVSWVSYGCWVRFRLTKSCAVLFRSGRSRVDTAATWGAGGLAKGNELTRVLNHHTPRRGLCRQGGRPVRNWATFCKIDRCVRHMHRKLGYDHVSSVHINCALTQKQPCQGDRHGRQYRQCNIPGVHLPLYQCVHVQCLPSPGGFSEFKLHKRGVHI